MDMRPGPSKAPADVSMVTSKAPAETESASGLLVLASSSESPSAMRTDDEPCDVSMVRNGKRIQKSTLDDNMPDYKTKSAALAEKRMKIYQTQGNNEMVVPKRNDEIEPQKVRRGLVFDRLSQEQAQDMINGKNGYYSTLEDEDGYMTPYILPLKANLLLVCSCSKIFFNDGSGQITTKHLKYCKGADEKTPRKKDEERMNKIPMISLTSKKYMNLVKIPQFFTYDEKLCLCVIYERTNVSCICGFKGIYNRPNFKAHMDDCSYLKMMLIPPNSNGYKPVDSISNNCNPVSHIYNSTTTSTEEKQLGDWNTVMNTKKTYYMYKPFEESSAKFYIPDSSHLQKNHMKRKMNSLDVCINSNWESIKNLISQVHNENWCAYPIQADRYEIQLSFDREIELKCWKQFCADYSYNCEDMHDILDYVKSESENDLGRAKYSAGKLSTPSLILCSNEDAQNFHLDIMGDNRKQYGMLLSHGSTTTMVCKPLINERIQKLEELIPILAKYTVNPGRGWENWNNPSTTLLAIIKSIDKGKKSVSDVNEGYGELFRICSTTEESKGENFAWKSVKVENSPVGTFYSVNGGEIHAGAGARKNQVRIFLFWTYHENALKKYNVDKQETKLSLMITIGGDCWACLHNMTLRKEMIFLIYYTYLTCDMVYRKTCARTFRNYIYISDMMQNFPELPKRNSTDMPKKIVTMVNKYAVMNDLFNTKTHED